MDTISWILTAFSIIGVILNAQQKISGFYFWMVANSGWIIVDATKGIYAQSALFVFYLFMCLYGVYTWKKKSH